MPTVFLGIGSNIDRVHNIKLGIKLLKKQFDDMRCSKVYQTAAIGFNGDDFYNLVVQFKAKLSIRQLLTHIHRIEDQAGRCKFKYNAKYQPRTLDIDLLMYGAVIDKNFQIPRDDITRYAFILRPLSELHPDFIHPVQQAKIITLWQQFVDSNRQLKPMRAIDIDLS